MTRQNRKRTAEQRRQERCSALADQQHKLREEAKSFLRKYYREEAKADALFDSAGAANSERLWTAWKQQLARKNSAWDRYKEAKAKAARLQSKWRRLCMGR